MSARDDYPSSLNMDRGDGREMSPEAYGAAMDEIDQLRADLAYMTEIAGGALALAFKDEQ